MKFRQTIFRIDSVRDYGCEPKVCPRILIDVAQDYGVHLLGDKLLHWKWLPQTYFSTNDFFDTIMHIQTCGRSRTILQCPLRVRGNGTCCYICMHFPPKYIQVAPFALFLLPTMYNIYIQLANILKHNGLELQRAVPEKLKTLK